MTQRALVGALGFLCLSLVGCGKAGGSSSATDPESTETVVVELGDLYADPTQASTPLPVPVLENLEPEPAEPVMELRLPADAARNVALGRKVTSSDMRPIRAPV